jgi:hypothetical protein
MESADGRRKKGDLSTKMLTKFQQTTYVWGNDD